MKSTIFLVRLNVPDTPSEGRLGGRSVTCAPAPLFQTVLYSAWLRKAWPRRKDAGD